MKKSILFISISLLLISCATPAHIIRQKFDPWVGQEISNLILKWGEPSSVYKLPNGNGSIYKWEYASQPVNNISMINYGNMSYGYSTPTQNFCKVEWITNQFDIIDSYRWEGRCKVK